MTDLEKRMVEAIRDDEEVGVGSCASIDECYTDEELANLLREAGVSSTEGALKWAYRHEGLWREQEGNQRWE